jgi:hypothetical protein
MASDVRALTAAPDENAPAGFESLKKQLEQIIAQQADFSNRLRENTDHLLTLHQLHDPLTWKKRGAILFAGAVTGTGLAAFLAHLPFHISIH